MHIRRHRKLCITDILHQFSIARILNFKIYIVMQWHGKYVTSQRNVGTFLHYIVLSYLWNNTYTVCLFICIKTRVGLHFCFNNDPLEWKYWTFLSVSLANVHDNQIKKLRECVCIMRWNSPPKGADAGQNVFLHIFSS